MNFKKTERLVKGTLHPRNKHHGQYNFTALTKTCPDLSACVIDNPRGEQSINFSDAESVLLLNKALLAHFYQITFWEIPRGYLCPPIPGRVDYIHYIADLLNESFAGAVPTNSQIKGLDIGCGANCIYPILGSRSYGWSFVGYDIDTLAVKTATLLVSANQNISKKIVIRQQKDPQHILSGVVKKSDRFAFTMCNPPFHASMEKATEGSLLKHKNLSKKSIHKQGLKAQSEVVLNFAGQPHELSCTGGEIAFVRQMVIESFLVKDQVCWFTCLLSKKENVSSIRQVLETQKALQIKVVEMSQGHKISRFIAWTYLDKQQRIDFFT